jgi:ATP-binding cassette, subfamily B, bacterial
VIPSKRTYGLVAHYAFGQWRWFLPLIVMNALIAGLAALQPWPLKLIVDHALGQDAGFPLPAILLKLSSRALITVAAGAMLSLFLVSSLLNAGVTWAWNIAGRRMVHDLSVNLLRKLQRLSLLFHSQYNVGDTLARFTGDTWGIYSAADALLIGPLHRALRLVLILAVAWKLDPVLTVVALGVVPALGGSARLFSARLKRLARANREAAGRLNGFVHQTLTAVPVIQSFGAEDRSRGQFEDLIAHEIRRVRRDNLVKSAFGSINGLLGAMGFAAIVFVGGHRVLAGAFSVGSLVVFMAYARSAQGALRGFVRGYANLKAAEASLERVVEVLDAEEQVTEAPDAMELLSRLEEEGCQLRVENVVFGYRPGVPVLRGVSLELLPGEVVALVGPTGSGKSTLMSLLPRLHDPWEGRISIDGVDAREATLRSWRDCMTPVFQDSLIMPVSVADNIAFGKPGSPREAVEAAARAAEAHGFIERLPSGYETILGERGSTLSGGERQRISIARAFLRDAPILLLDEPTSALDSGTEALILTALERLMKDRAVLVIAHRLSTVARADRILVLVEGRIVEAGTHEDLLGNGGVYQRLYETQFGGGTGVAA